MITGGVLRLLSSNKSDVSEDEDDSGDEGDKYYNDLSIMAYRQISIINRAPKVFTFGTCH